MAFGSEIIAWGAICLLNPANFGGIVFFYYFIGVKHFYYLIGDISEIYLYSGYFLCVFVWIGSGVGTKEFFLEDNIL